MLMLRPYHLTSRAGHDTGTLQGLMENKVQGEFREHEMAGAGTR